MSIFFEFIGLGDEARQTGLFAPSKVSSDN